MENEFNELISAWKICYTGTKTPLQQQAFSFIENFKQNSPNVIEIAYKLAIQNDVPEHIHFGLQLISHCIKFKWNSLNIEKKVEIKNALNSILNQNENLNESSLVYKLNYLKTSLCLTYLELVKREWPQNWPTLLNELYMISTKSMLHLNLVLNLYKFMAEEFIANNVSLPPTRRKDINHYMTANMQEIFGFFLNTLKTCYDVYKVPGSQSGQIASLLETCIDCMSYYVDWIGINYVVDKDFLLINILLDLLCESRLGVASAKCLIVFVSRKCVPSERQLLLYLFNENPLNQIFNCVKNSLFSKIDEDRDYLKYLITTLVEMGKS
jgi:exportin-5